MSFWSRLFGGGSSNLSDEERRKLSDKLDGKRRHLRGKLARNQGELKQVWTKYRLAKESKEKKDLKAQIKHLEGLRKSLVKDMRKVQDEMKRLGFEPAAGHVEMH